MSTMPAEQVVAGAKPAEDLKVGDVVDGISGPVRITDRRLRDRADMAPLVMLRAEDGQQFRFEPGHDVPFYERGT